MEAGHADPESRQHGQFCWLSKAGRCRVAVYDEPRLTKRDEAGMDSTRQLGCHIVLPGRPDCCWTATAPETSYPTLTGLGGADVAVVGAGIVGLTAAYLLAQAGLSVAVLEASRIGRQVTGRSTAKITSQHALIYRRLIDTLGIDHAQRYAEANRSGAQQICSWVDELGIACDLEPKDAYTYTCDPTQRDDIAAEAEAARRAGFDAELLDRAPLPFETAAALRFRDQAQFNPVQYLIGLALAVEAAGGRIFEKTRVTAVDAGSRWRVTANEGSLDVEHVVIATHFPIAGPACHSSARRPRRRQVSMLLPASMGGASAMARPVAC